MRTHTHASQLDLSLVQPVSPRNGAVVARLSIPPSELKRPVSRSKPEVEKRVDWFRVITDMSRAGYSAHVVANVIGVARTTLIGWKQGAEPRYTEGERLVDLWCRTLRKDRSKLPMVTIADYWAYHSKA